MFSATISGKGCTAMPGFAEADWDSIKISRTTSCVQLYDSRLCQGDSVLLRPGYPHLHDIWWWGFNPRNRANYVKSISRCGAFCPAVGTPPVPFTTEMATTQMATTQMVTTQTTPSTTTEMTTTQFIPTTKPVTISTILKSEAIEPVASVSPSVTSTEEKEPSEDSHSFLWLICISIFLTLLFVAGLGVFIYRRYQNSRPTSGFNVEYQLQRDALL